MKWFAVNIMMGLIVIFILGLPPARITSVEIIMKIPCLTVLTLGVVDLYKASLFYEAILGTKPN